MRKLILLAAFWAFVVYGFSQPKFDIGLKGGVNFSKLSLNIEDYSAESITRSHFGAFTRIGWNRFYIQPELYFSGKGGDITSDLNETITSVDLKTFDIPVLLGYRIIKGKAFDFHVVAGPVFSKITSEDFDSGDLNSQYINNHYSAIQYGLGIDVLFLTIDARMENGIEDVYSEEGVSFKNQNFMISIGFKIL